MGAERGHQHRAAVAIVAGIDDVLQAGREVDAAPDVDGVISLQNIFAAVVELAIAEEKAEAAIGQVGLVILLDGVRDKRESGAILFAMPPCTVCA